MSHLFYGLDVSLCLWLWFWMCYFFVFHSCQLCLYPLVDGCSHSVFINEFCLCVFSLAIRDGSGSGVCGIFFLLCEDYIANAMLICMWDVRFLWKFEFEWQFLLFFCLVFLRWANFSVFLISWPPENNSFKLKMYFFSVRFVIIYGKNFQIKKIRIWKMAFRIIKRLWDREKTIFTYFFFFEKWENFWRRRKMVFTIAWIAALWCALYAYIQSNFDMYHILQSWML